MLSSGLLSAGIGTAAVGGCGGQANGSGAPDETVWRTDTTVSGETSTVTGPSAIRIGR